MLAKVLFLFLLIQPRVARGSEGEPNQDVDKGTFVEGRAERRRARAELTKEKFRNGWNRGKTGQERANDLAKHRRDLEKQRGVLESALETEQRKIVIAEQRTRQERVDYILASWDLSEAVVQYKLETLNSICSSADQTEQSDSLVRQDVTRVPANESNGSSRRRRERRKARKDPMSPRTQCNRLETDALHEILIRAKQMYKDHARLLEEPILAMQSRVGSEAGLDMDSKVTHEDCVQLLQTFKGEALRSEEELSAIDKRGVRYGDPEYRSSYKNFRSYVLLRGAYKDEFRSCMVLWESIIMNPVDEYGPKGAEVILALGASLREVDEDITRSKNELRDPSLLEIGAGTNVCRNLVVRSCRTLAHRSGWLPMVSIGVQVPVPTRSRRHFFFARISPSYGRMFTEGSRERIFSNSMVAGYRMALRGSAAFGFGFDLGLGYSARSLLWKRQGSASTPRAPNCATGDAYFCPLPWIFGRRGYVPRQVGVHAFVFTGGVWIRVSPWVKLRANVEHPLFSTTSGYFGVKAFETLSLSVEVNVIDWLF